MQYLKCASECIYIYTCTVLTILNNCVYVYLYEYEHNDCRLKSSTLNDLKSEPIVLYVPTYNCSHILPLVLRTLSSCNYNTGTLLSMVLSS